MRKSLTAFTLTIFLTTLATFPAHAVAKVSNGVLCSKLNASAKVGTKTYLCSSGTVIGSSKLVWLSKDCINTNKQYVSAKSKFEQLTASATKASAAAKASVEAVKNKIQLGINRMILWKTTKIYSKDDVVFQQNGTYYISLTSNNSGKLPTENLGVDWAVYKPTPNNPQIGTSPDVESVISWKQRDVSKWSASLDNVNKAIKSIQALTKPTAKDLKNLKTLQSLASTLSSGISAGNKNIANMQSFVRDLITQNSLITSVEAQKKLIEANKADITQLNKLQTSACTKGK